MTMPFFGAGMVEVPPEGYKRMKNSRKMQMIFFVHEGRVTVDVGDIKFGISKGGVWQVPRGTFDSRLLRFPLHPVCFRSIYFLSIPFYFEKLEKNSGVHTAFLCQQRDVSATNTQESPSQAIDRSHEPAFSYDGRRNRRSERWFIDRVTTLPACIVEYVQYTWRDQIQPVQLQLAPFLRTWNGVCARAPYVTDLSARTRVVVAVG